MCKLSDSDTMSSPVHLLLCVVSCSLLIANAQQVRELTACVGNRWSISCPPGSVIQIQELLLADSECWRSLCCPSSSDCTGQPSYGHRTAVVRGCNGRTSCGFETEKRGIGCGLGYNANNDYERVKYICVAVSTTSSTTITTTTSLSRVAAAASSTHAHSIRTALSARIPEESHSVTDTDPGKQTTAQVASYSSSTDAMTEKDDKKMEPLRLMMSSHGNTSPSDDTTSFKWSHVVFISATVITVFILLIVMNAFLWIRLKRRRRRYPIPAVLSSGSSGSSMKLSPGVELMTLESLIRPTVFVKATPGANSGSCAVNGTLACSGQPPTLPRVRQTITVDNQYEKMEYHATSGAEPEDAYCEPRNIDEVMLKDGCIQEEIYEDVDGYLMPFVNFDGQPLKHSADDDDEVAADAANDSDDDDDDDETPSGCGVKEGP